MEIKLVALFVLLATASIQAEQIKMPSLEILINRLEAFGNAHPEEGSVGRMLLEESGFLAEIADKELDSAYVAMRLRMAAVVFGALEYYFINNFDFLVKTGVSNEQARVDSGVIAKQHALRLLKLKLEEDSLLAKELFNNFVENALGGQMGYSFCVPQLYTVFLQDFPKALAEELEKFSS